MQPWSSAYYLTWRVASPKNDYRAPKMPPARKACDRCREHKARCIWTSGTAACVRCQRSKHACSAPQSTDLPTPRDSPGHEDRRHLDSIESTDGRSQLSTGSVGYSNQRDTVHEQLTPSGDVLPQFSKFSVDAEPPFVDGSCASTKCYLPSPEEGFVLLQEFLHDFNSRIPLFSPESLYNVYQDCYSGLNDSVPLPWVLVYGTLALTHRLRAMSLFAMPVDNPQGQWYLDKCMAKLPELLMGPPSLKLVQASLCICLLLQTSNQRERSALFASTALHMAQDLGYNELPESHLSDTLLGREQAYSFWIAFVADTSMSLSHLRTSSQRLADISTPLPPQRVVDWWDLSNNEPAECEWNLNIFAQNCSLALIEAEAAENLFSAAARKRSPIDNPCVYKDILSKLERWRESNALTKLDATEVLKAVYRSDIVHCVMFEAAYFRILYQLQATKVLVGFRARIDVFTAEALQAMVEQKATSCYADARRFLKLTSIMPQGNLSTTWASFQAITAALCTIVTAHAAGQPGSSLREAEDLQLCYDVVLALGRATEDEVDSAHQAVIDLCRSLYVQFKGP